MTEPDAPEPEASDMPDPDDPEAIKAWAEANGWYPYGIEAPNGGKY